VPKRALSDYYHVHRSKGKNVAEETLTVGTPIIIPQDSPNGRYGAFFEDEGETGYFYAVDFSRLRTRLLTRFTSITLQALLIAISRLRSRLFGPTME